MRIYNDLFVFLFMYKINQKYNHLDGVTSDYGLEFNIYFLEIV